MVEKGYEWFFLNCASKTSKLERRKGRPEGPTATSPGQRPGNCGFSHGFSRCKCKSFCPFRARFILHHTTQGVALGWWLLALQAVPFYARACSLSKRSGERTLNSQLLNNPYSSDSSVAIILGPLMRSFFVMPLRISMRMPSLKPVFTLRRSYSFLSPSPLMT